MTKVRSWLQKHRLMSDKKVSAWYCMRWDSQKIWVKRHQSCNTRSDGPGIHAPCSEAWGRRAAMEYHPLQNINTQLCQQHWDILRLSLHWNAVIFLYSYHHHPHLWCAASACSQRLPLPVWWVGTAESMAAVMRNEPLWGQVRPCCWLSTREWTQKQQVNMRLHQLAIAPVFGVTWSFRNQSNMLLKKTFIIIMIL